MYRKLATALREDGGEKDTAVRCPHPEHNQQDVNSLTDGNHTPEDLLPGIDLVPVRVEGPTGFLLPDPESLPRPVSALGDDPRRSARGVPR